mmetsp:Transcript_38197/g.89634  ORF Transcript_38197/g.89634 Transcript_38197/m.89634 type:complete len:276 (+) Transcript_38197:1090-1917(+)
MNLQGHKLLKLPVPVGEHVSVAASQDHLLSIVLCHGCIAFVDCEQREGTNANDGCAQINELLERHCVAHPLVQTWSQDHRLTPIESQADEALRHGDDGAIAMEDDRLRQRHIPFQRDKDTNNLVYTGPIEEVASVLVASWPHTASRYGKLLHEALIRHTTNSQTCHPGKTTLAKIRSHSGVRRDDVQLRDALYSVRMNDEAGVMQGLVGRRLLLFQNLWLGRNPRPRSIHSQAVCCPETLSHGCCVRHDNGLYYYSGSSTDTATPSVKLLIRTQA